MSEEEGKVIEMTPEQEKRAMKEAMRKHAIQHAEYKKRLKEAVELKRLQVEELELNIKYYQYKKQWLDTQPLLEELEAKEMAILQKQAEEEAKRIEEMKATKKEKVPEIIIPKVGKPREKEEVKEEVKEE